MLAVLGYGAGFFANRGVPTSIDGAARARWPGAAVIDLALLGLFAVQHTVMARPGVQAALGPAAARRGGAGHVRAGRQPGPGPAVLAVAAARAPGCGG